MENNHNIWDFIIKNHKEDKTIIGYLKVSDILSGNISKILKLTSYDKHPNGNEIIDYHRKNNQSCFALKLYDVIEDIKFTYGDDPFVRSNSKMG